MQSLGLSSDAAGQRILQHLAQSGSRLDSALMQKAARLAKKFKGKETAAAEVALALEEKGVDSDSLALDGLMDLLGGDLNEGGSGRDCDRNDAEDGGKKSEEGFAVQENGGSSGNEETDVNAASFVLKMAEELRRWFDSILKAAEESEKSVSPDFCGKKKKGGAFLPLFNQSAPRSSWNGKKSWAFFPFEIERSSAQKNNGGGEKQGALFEAQGGTLGLYLDYEKKFCEKMTAIFKSSSGKICFVVYFEGKKARAVRAFASETLLQNALQENLKAIQGAFGSETDVEVLPFKKFSAFGIEDLPLGRIEAFA